MVKAHAFVIDGDTIATVIVPTVTTTVRPTISGYAPNTPEYNAYVSSLKIGTRVIVVYPNGMESICEINRMYRDHKTQMPLGIYCLTTNRHTVRVSLRQFDYTVPRIKL